MEARLQGAGFEKIEYVKQLAAGARRCRDRARLASPPVAQSLRRLAERYGLQAAALMNVGTAQAEQSRPHVSC